MIDTRSCIRSVRSSAASLTTRMRRPVCSANRRNHSNPNRVSRSLCSTIRVPQSVLLQCLFDRFGSVFPQCGLMVFPGVVIVSR